MSKKNDLILSLDDETFSKMKADWDAVLNRTLGNMQMKGATDATVTCKMTVSIDKRSITVGDATQEYTQPSFKHEVNSVLQIKDKMTGQLSGEYAMVWDDELQKFVLRQVNGGQTSMFDDDYETVDAEVVNEAPALMAPGLPLPVEEAEVDTEAFETMMQYTQQELVIVESNGVYTVRKVDNMNDVILSSGCEDSSPFKLNPVVAAEHVGHNLSCYMFTEDGKYIAGIAIDCTDCDETVFTMAAPAETYAIPEEESEAEGDAEEENDGDLNEVPPFADPDEGYEYDEPEEEA